MPDAQDPSVLAAILSARAVCIEAALQQRTMSTTPEETIAKAEAFWGWVSQPLADNQAQPGPLTDRKRSR